MTESVVRWPNVKLDSIAQRGSGHTPSKQHPEYWDGSVKWVSLKDTFRLDQGLIRATEATITPAGLAHSSAVLHPAGSVVLLRDAGIGKSGVLGSDMAVSQHFMVWSCGSRLDNWFLYYVLQSRKAEFERISNGSTIKTIGLGYFRQMAVPLPDLREQRRIAAALRHSDNEIVALQRMITKKEAVRRGMMQQLLTGRTRLSGFTAEWNSAPLGAHATGLRGAGLSRSALSPVGRYECILYGELFTTYGRRIEQVESRTDVDGGVRACIGDVLVPGSTTTIPRDLATASAVHVDGVVIGGDTNIVRSDGSVDADWLAYYITYALGDRIAEVAQGTTIKHLYVRDLLRCEIPLPEPAEQRAIARVLTDAERDLALAGRRMVKARDVKTGMMQQLLTGRTRLTAEAP